MPEQRRKDDYAPVAAKPSAVRKAMVVLLFVTVVINYLDRSSISIAGPGIADDLHLTPVQSGLVFSAFAWAYSPLQIPGSLLVDRLRTRVLYPLTILCWSLFATLQGLTSSMWQLVATRMGVGACEAPSYPMNNRIVTAWLPEAERARGVAFYVSGQYVGLAFLAPVLAWLQRAFGWRGMFLITGSLGLAWAGLFYLAYRDPEASYAAGHASIPKGNGLAAGENAGNAALVTPWVAFRNRKMWGLLLAHMGEACTNWFFLTWFPTYLVKYRHIAFLKAGFMATLPFLAAWVGVLLSGWLSDRLLRSGCSLSLSRKLPIVSGMLLATTLVGASFVDSPALIIMFMTLAFFGSGLAAISWSVVSTIAPLNLVGLTSGAFNFVGTSMGIAVPLVIGLLVKGGDFSPALVFVGGMAVMSVFCWTVVVGEIARIE